MSLADRSILTRRARVALVVALVLITLAPAHADGTSRPRRDAWPRWRGPLGDGVARDVEYPLRWGTREGIAWSRTIPGEGASSAIVAGKHVFVTAARESGSRRALLCLDRRNGELLWRREFADEDPELSSAITGHAASTPAFARGRVVAFFGNAGAIACDEMGELLWRRSLGRFETELGLASSPLIHEGRVVLLCDHDGDRFTSFDSYLVALDLETGSELWKVERPELLRSWSTPLALPESHELLVAGQDELRAHDTRDGSLIWRWRGLTPWVTPTPVFDDARVYACSGKNGPVVALRRGGRGDITETHVDWIDEGRGAYVSSPLLHDGRLYVIREKGILAAYRARDGKLLFRARIGGTHRASPVAAAGKIYFVSTDGVTAVIRASDRLEVLARNELGERVVSSPALSGGEIFLRTETKLFCIQGTKSDTGSAASEARRSALERALSFLSAEVARWPREKKCFSCHNSGDGARALLAARSRGLEIDLEGLKSTLDWLARPAGWESDERFLDYGDPDLTRVQFASTLAGAARARVPVDSSALAVAAELLARRQAEDGQWRGGSNDVAGSPTAYSRALATAIAVDVLAEIDPRAHAARIERGRAWLAALAPRNTHEAMVSLLAATAAGAKIPAKRAETILELLRMGEGENGGWGPFTNSAPEVFDTALALLALTRLHDSPNLVRDFAKATDEIDRWIRRGRLWLLHAQEGDGGWAETTRPAGGESYAQRVSTSAWATFALLATEPR